MPSFAWRPTGSSATASSPGAVVADRGDDRLVHRRGDLEPVGGRDRRVPSAAAAGSSRAALAGALAPTAGASVRAERGHREDDKDAEADEKEDCPVPRTPNGA